MGCIQMMFREPEPGELIEVVDVDTGHLPNDPVEHVLHFLKDRLPGFEVLKFQVNISVIADVVRTPLKPPAQAEPAPTQTEDRE